ncbi:uncharacterized protein LOC131034797 [Cryptomeria japonica]|uniref:uncharacterized protein LOC131034797 n=1 Tax=Cryptomeria japonica TaxID=3369 RepID=UPI0027DAA98A|nr:uncharacterized protein LOC131034797 [Cryptomeria japonica]XP_057822381.2 uncharacterized protein LOC131034797 [Cryptomeria japonica]XP_057822382.2 uncharacterized protein LOC131034797 [Cryptomeria japonica]XP_057822383.2 uncharacterized protein LOC131034797 [Cryptomeria japonica]
MKRSLLIICVFLIAVLAPCRSTVFAAPPGIVGGPLSALLKWVWSTPAVISKTDRSFLQFESGYVVETVLEGSKLGIDPYTIEVSPDGELLILDSDNSNIHRLTPPLSRYSRARLVAGSTQGYSGHVDGKPKDARFNHPKGFTVDDRGNIYIADTVNLAIRKIGQEGVTTIAGGRSNKAGHVDGPSEGAKFSSDFDVVYVSSTCSLLVVDRGNQAIREISLQYDDCAYNYAASYPSGILMVAGALSVGYIFGLLQHQGFGSITFGRRARQDKPSKKKLPSPIKTDRPSLIPVEGQSENVDAGWMSFGKFIWDLFKFVVEIIGSIFTSISNFILRKNPQKKGDLWPLHDTIPIPDDDVEPRPISRNRQDKGDLWPDRDSLPIPDDDYKSKVDPIWKNSVPFEDSDDHNPKPEPLKVQNLRLRSTKDSKGVSSYKEFKFYNNYKRGDKDDQSHPRSLRHRSSAPQTHYDKPRNSSSEVVFGAAQGNKAKNEAVDIKPVDYGDPMYDHYNIRNRGGYGNLFDF